MCLLSPDDSNGPVSPRQCTDVFQNGAELITNGSNVSDKSKERRRRLRIVSQNCRGLKKDEDLEELYDSLIGEEIFAACLQETWREGVEKLERSGKVVKLLLVGKKQQEGRGSCGVGIALGGKGIQAWKDAGSLVFDGFGPCLMATRLLVKDDRGKDVGIHLISLYRHTDWDWGEFQATLDRCVAKKRPGDIVLIGADGNASMGSNHLGVCGNRTCGKFGNRRVTEPGKKLLAILTQRTMALPSTFFRSAGERSYGTWEHFGSGKLYQIDHFICYQQDMKRVTNCTRWKKRDLVNSDHRAVIITLNVACKLQKRKPDERTKLITRDYSSIRGANEMADQNKVKFAESVMERVRKSDPSMTKHDILSKALEETSAELPKVGKRSPPWFCKAREELEPLLKQRNDRVKEYMSVSPHPSKKKLRGRLKKLVKHARKVWDKAVIGAKSAWVESHCMAISNECVGAFDCGKKVWEAIKQLKGGISKTKPSTDVPLKTKAGVACKDAAENAARFKEHFSELYSKEEWYDSTVLDSIPQHDPSVWKDQGRTPDLDEIKVAVRRLNVSGPGATGISAAVLKALLLHDEAFSCLADVVLHFWETEEVPPQWEECLLKILPKSGDLSQPGNYRGIMLLEVLLKVVKQLLKARLQPIQESLDHESQCGFRPNKGCSDANFVIRLCVKRRREHGLETWVLLLDLVKAFDRVPRSLLWKVMLKLGYQRSWCRC